MIACSGPNLLCIDSKIGNIHCHWNFWIPPQFKIGIWFFPRFLYFVLFGFKIFYFTLDSPNFTTSKIALIHLKSNNINKKVFPTSSLAVCIHPDSIFFHYNTFLFQHNRRDVYIHKKLGWNWSFGPSFTIDNGVTEG